MEIFDTILRQLLVHLPIIEYHDDTPKYGCGDMAMYGNEQKYTETLCDCDRSIDYIAKMVCPWCMGSLIINYSFSNLVES